MDTSSPMLSIIGLMSGTSVDGIDAALVTTDGTTLSRTPHVLTGQYRDVTKQAVLQVVNNPEHLLTDRSSAKELEQLIAEDHAAVVNQLKKQAAITIDLLGFHGQTVYHNPDAALTIQLGDASALANLTGISTVYDFRLNDMVNGGQGAPLAPIYHQYLLSEFGVAAPAAFLNIGGISNVTLCSGDSFLGFDCGPGNCLMDDYMRQHFDRSYDEAGAEAAKGRVDEALLTQLMSDAYFKLAPPKSLDRQYFFAKLDQLRALNVNDAMATLNAFTVEAIVHSIQRMPTQPTSVIVAGGGQHNAVLMSNLHSKLPCDVKTADELGMDGDYTEAELMAYLAARHQYQQPYTYPGTTGVNTPSCGGKTVEAKRHYE